MPSKLSNIQIEKQISQLNGWSLVGDSSDSITCNYKFNNFSEAFSFMTQSALAAEKIDHHPEWSNIYNSVEVLLTTHDVKGLSKKDFILAHEMNNIASKYNIR
tara:strand:+ start:242 stop:550 length:309 start_codon:yes stop_codon:yes gene_type:complete